MFKLVSERSGCHYPRYTSYPPANRLAPVEHSEEIEAQLKRYASTLSKISLYGHIPFCETLCFFCACNREVTKDKRRSRRYLDALTKEIQLVGRNFFGKIPVHSVHFGGGTPNYLSSQELDELITAYKENFTWNSDTHFSIELDPRTTNSEQLKLLGRHGCVRVSVGVQDFDAAVQRRINRVQSIEQTRAVFDMANASGINSTGVDIIYGLPLQTRKSFEKTLKAIVDINPDRIATFGYAHVQSLAPGQQSFLPEELPDHSLRIDLFSDAIDFLTSNGYRFIGIDHFVKESDPLFQAFVSGNLGRSFMGYTSERGIPVVATGASAISIYPDLLIQNVRSIKKYEEFFLDSERKSYDLPIGKTFKKDRVEVVTSEIIESLLTVGNLNFNALADKFDQIVFMLQTKATMRLREFEKMGLLELTVDSLQLTRLGQIFARAIASCFDQEFQDSMQSETALQRPTSLII